MFVELIDQLRCPEPHEETWLVMSAHDTRDRHVLRGTLGCPVCHRQYTVDTGTVYFGAMPDADASRDVPAPEGDWPFRLAALLDLTAGGGAVGLYGRWSAYGDAIGSLVEGIEPVAILPAGATDPMLSAIVPRARDRIPLVAGSLRAVAVDDPRSSPQAMAEAARIVRRGGRLLAPSGAPVPHGIRELARDADWWVGERDAAPSAVVPIAVRRR